MSECTFPEATLLNNIVSWSVSAGLSSQYAGSVDLTNEDAQYDASSWLLLPILISMDSGATVWGIPGAEDLLTGSVDWINGLVADVSPVEGISEKRVSFKIKSFASRLAAKAVNTEVYDSASAATVLDDLASIFGTLPGALYDFSGCQANAVSGCVSGNSLIDEMRLIAQAGYSTLFVSADGILTAGAWRDTNSAITHVIPDELISDAKQDLSSAPVPSRLRIRGSFFSRRKDGDRDFGKSQRPPSDTATPDRGPVIFWILNGVAQPEAPLGVRGVSADGGDIANAQVITTLKLVRRESAGDGGLDVYVTKAQPGEDYLGRGNFVCGVRIFGKHHPDLEFVTAAIMNREGAKTQEEVAQKIVAMMDFIGGSATPRRAAGGTSPSGPANSSQSKTADESEETQLEMVVTDPDLLSQFGVVDEQITNTYLATPEQLFDVAVRRFQETRMIRRSWTVSVAYMPDLRINDVVTFNTPETLDGGNKSVTGVVAKMSIAWSVGPVAKMTIIVEDFEDIGATTYVSENLLLNADLRAIDLVVWIANGTLFVDLWCEEGTVWLSSVDGSYLRQNILVESGVTCTASVEGVLLLGVPLGSLSLVVTDTVTTDVLGTAVVSGSTSFDFTSTANPLEFKLVVTGGGTGLWRLSKIKLTKTVVR